jgi:hypothetical protein
MLNAQMDLITLNGAQGEVAKHFSATGQLNPNEMRPFIGQDGQAYVTVYKGGDPKKPENYAVRPVQTNATTLRRDEWKTLDQALLKLKEYRLGGVQDLIDAGLTYQIGNGMGSTVLEYHDVSNALEADLTMDGITRALGDRPVYTTNYLPLPIIHADYEINARVLAASRNLGNALDTTLVERAGRKVMEKLENMLFTNTTYAFGGGTIYSYINHPSRNIVTLAQNWDASGKTGAEIISDVLTAKQTLINAYCFGDFQIYIPTDYETVLDEDYDTSGQSTQTIRDRIMKISGVRGIKVIDTLPDDNILFVTMQPDTVRLVQGMGMQNVEWQVEGKMLTKYKVMTIQVPQIRADQDGNCGIVHMS